MWLPFLLAITALTLTPGLDSLLVMRNAARGGTRDGLLTSFGICLGLFFHASLSAAGLSAILMGSAELFTLIKIAGACYLVFLGLQSIRSAFCGKGQAIVAAQITRPVSGAQSLREGLLSNVLNPKPIVFYMAFLPQFIDPAYSPVPQALVMAAIHFSIGMLWQGGLVLMVDKARDWLQKPKVSQVIDSVTGVLLVAFGAKLASTS